MIRRKTIITQLKGNPLFESLSTTQLELIADYSRQVNYYKGDNIELIQESLDYLYFMVSGKTKLCEVDDQGNEIILGLYKENDFFGDLTTQPISVHFEYLEAISDHVMILRIPNSIIKEIMISNANFSYEMTAEIWSKYRSIEKRFRNLSHLKNVKSRLVYFFLDWALSEGERKGNSIKLENYLTHKDIASLICSTRVTVTQILNQLRTSGNLYYSKSEIVITDINKFAA
jgi:CRP/FNR family transcriptional regulator